MKGEPADADAVAEFQKVGLTEYQAQCFVGLSRIGSGTAKEISEVAALPRTRVYDVAESLHELGLVEISDGEPRTFRAVGADHALALLRERFTRDLDAAGEALRGLPAPDTESTDGHTWTITGQDNVVHRGQYLAAQAESELFGFFTVDAVFTDNCYHQAELAIERGANVVLAASDEALRADLRARFPSATIWNPTLDWNTLEGDGSQLSRLVMADREMVMLASVSEADADLTETAVWGRGAGSEIVLLVRELIGSQIDDLDLDDEAADFPM